MAFIISTYALVLVEKFVCLFSFIDEKHCGGTRRRRAIRLLFDVLVFGSLIYIGVRYFSLRVNFEQLKIETAVGK